jgi:activator of HSP90 ATPase
MNETTYSTRRHVITGAAMALGALVTRSSAQTPSRPAPLTPATEHLTALRQQIELNAAPARIYAALLDSKQFTTFSGLPAEIDPKVGGAFSMFGGQIVGITVELVPNKRIVQAWRPTHWDAGVFSSAKFELKSNAASTTVVLDHTGFPEGEFASLDWGWHSHYWDPLRKFLA